MHLPFMWMINCLMVINGSVKGGNSGICKVPKNMDMKHWKGNSSKNFSEYTIQLNEHAWPMNVTLHKYFIDDRMTILAKSKNVIFLCFYVFCGLAHFYSSFKTILSIWLTDFHLIRCSLSQNMMTRLDFDTLLLSLNHLIIIICEKKVFVDFPQMYRSMSKILELCN